MEVSVMKKITAIMLIFMFVLSLGISAFAETTTTQTGVTGTVSTQTVSPDMSAQSTLTTTDTIGKDDWGKLASSQVPKVTIDQASTWVERKGNDGLGFLQTMVQPFAVIIFIFCAFMTLIGAFGNSQLVGRGILGMFIAVVMYAVVLYAPEILDFILGWLKS